MSRPSKYSSQVLREAEGYIIGCVSNNTIPFIEELALKLSVNDDTIVEWSKRYSEFSATIDRLKSLQKLSLMKGGLEKRYHANFAMFLLKANHDMNVSNDENPHVFGGYIVVPEKKPEGYGAICT